MSLKSDLLDTLEMLNPYIDPTKGQLEGADAAKSISTFLSQDEGLYWLEYIISKLGCGKFPLYVANKFVSKNKLDSVVENLYKSNKLDTLKFLLLYYHQFFGHEESNDDNRKFGALKKLANSAAVQSQTIVVSFCLQCFYASDNQFQICPQCNNDDVFSISSILLLPQAKTVLKNGQYLEIYTKQCFQESGVELIGYSIDPKGKKAFTNVRYQVDGDQMEVDIHGIATPLTLLLCEVKTVAKIASNELRRVDGLYDHLIEKINTVSARKFAVLKIFVITGEFDINISESAYKRKNWELIDRSKIQNLTTLLKEIQVSL